MPGDRVEANSRVMLGKPVIRGTRIPVELILRRLAEGATEEELLDAYRHLTREDLRAAIVYAADAVASRASIAAQTRGTFKVSKKALRAVLNEDFLAFLV